MEVKQVYELVNAATKETIGESAVLAQDLSNVIDVGQAVYNAGDNAVDNYVKSLINHIGKVIFVNRPYSGGAPSVLMDGWEYGSVLEKVSADIPEATENEAWELVNGASYDPNIFYKPEVQAKFFNKRTTFEVDRSIAGKQVKESFSSAAQLNGFASLIFDTVDKSLTIKVDSLIMRTIGSMIADTIHADYGSGAVAEGSHVKAVNLLYLYNQRYNAQLTATNAMTDPAFLRFAAYTVAMYQERMQKISTLFNIGAQPRFTSRDRMKTVLLSDFAKGAEFYLENSAVAYGRQPDGNALRLPEAGLGRYDSVPYWQGTGTGYDFADISRVNVTSGNGNAVDQTGVIGVVFDRDALGVSNIDRTVRTQYVVKADFFNYFYTHTAGYFNDDNENFVVFLVA